MSGIESDTVGNTVQTSSGGHSYVKPAVEVVFDIQKEPNGVDLGDGQESRIARGIAALQRSGGGVVKLPPKAELAAPKAIEASAAGTRDAGGIEVVEVDGDGKPIVAPDVTPEAAKSAEVAPEAEKPAEKDAAPVVSPETAQIASDLKLAQARIDSLVSGAVPDEDYTAWLDDPVGDIKASIMRRTGMKADDPRMSQAIDHYQWSLTIHTLGAQLPKEIKERNENEHVKRRDSLAEIARTAQGGAKTAREGRESDHRLIGEAFDAEPDQYPYAAVAAKVHLGGLPAGDAAVILWKQAVEAGTVKSSDPKTNAKTALRLYNEFSKTRLDSVQLKNATPPPADAPAASQKAAPGASAAKGKTPTMSSKQAAAAPAATKVTEAPKGPEVIDASDKDARTRRLAEIAARRFPKK